MVVAGHPVYTVKNPVLHRVGILEFIDHRHRKLPTNSACQAFALGAAQRGIQSCEQVVKAHTGQALFFAVQATGDPAGGMIENVRFRHRHGFQCRFEFGDGVHGRMMRRLLLAGPFFGKRVRLQGIETLGALARQELMRFSRIGCGPFSKVFHGFLKGVFGGAMQRFRLSLRGFRQQLFQFVAPGRPGGFQSLQFHLPQAFRFLRSGQWVTFRHWQGINVWQQVAH